jgi:transposase
MYYVGIDLHKRDLVAAVEDERGPVGRPRSFACRNEAEILKHMSALRPFRAVIEASASYRWLYDLLSPLGEVVLAHPSRLKMSVSQPAKTDKLDAALLARLLRMDAIPRSYVPPAKYQELRELTRARGTLSRAATQAKNHLHHLLWARNIHAPYKSPFGVRGRRWMRSLDLGVVGNLEREELLGRLDHYDAERDKLDALIEERAADFPQIAALSDIRGIGLYSALLIVAEIGEPERFSDGSQVACYAGLVARVNQSGGHDYHGHITRQGSTWLRWILVQAAIKVIGNDRELANFYARVRKRSSRHIARVAVARKLAEICWIRLRRWHREHAAAA